MTVDLQKRIAFLNPGIGGRTIGDNLSHDNTLIFRIRFYFESKHIVFGRAGFFFRRRLNGCGDGFLFSASDDIKINGLTDFRFCNARSQRFKIADAFAVETDDDVTAFDAGLFCGAIFHDIADQGAVAIFEVKPT